MAKDAKFKKMRTENIKALRKLASEREKVEGKLSRRNVVSDYSSFASQVRVTATRIQYRQSNLNIVVSSLIEIIEFGELGES